MGKKKLVEQEWWEENCVKQTLVKQEWSERKTCGTGVVGRELCEANPCEARVVGKKRLVEQEWWERNAWWSRSGGEAHPCQAELLERTIWKIEKRWKTGGAGTTRA